MPRNIRNKNGTPTTPGALTGPAVDIEPAVHTLPQYWTPAMLDLYDEDKPDTTVDMNRHGHQITLTTTAQSDNPNPAYTRLRTALKKHVKVQEQIDAHFKNTLAWLSGAETKTIYLTAIEELVNLVEHEATRTAYFANLERQRAEAEEAKLAHQLALATDPSADPAE